jgi:gas vesicle protein
MYRLEFRLLVNRLCFQENFTHSEALTVQTGSSNQDDGSKSERYRNVSSRSWSENRQQQIVAYVSSRVSPSVSQLTEENRMKNHMQKTQNDIAVHDLMSVAV